MAVYDLRKASNVASGQTKVSLDGNLEERVSNIEDKLDTLITLLKKEDNNAKDRPKPISGNDSGV